MTSIEGSKVPWGFREGSSRWANSGGRAAGSRTAGPSADVDSRRLVSSVRGCRCEIKGVLTLEAGECNGTRTCSTAERLRQVWSSLLPVDGGVGGEKKNRCGGEERAA